MYSRLKEVSYTGAVDVCYKNIVGNCMQCSYTYPASSYNLHLLYHYTYDGSCIIGQC